MYVFHGSWISSEGLRFENEGRFVFWIESPCKDQSRCPEGTHPRHIYRKKQLHNFLENELPLKKPLLRSLSPRVTRVYAILPSCKDKPLPSPEMAQLTGEIVADDFHWQSWKIWGLSVREPLLFLKEIQFLVLYETDHFRLGSDLQFWIQYARSFREIVSKHQYIPNLSCYQAAATGKRKKSRLEICCGWEPVGNGYEQGIADYAQAMPLLCAAVRAEKSQESMSTSPAFLDTETLLRHFSEQMLETLVMNTPMTQKLTKQFKGHFLSLCLSDASEAAGIAPTLEQWRQWQAWKQGLRGKEAGIGFALGLRLMEADAKQPDNWTLEFFVESRQDPSLKLSLEQYWAMNRGQREAHRHFLGKHFERDLLLGLGQAARICPLLWEGLECDQPSTVRVDMETAFDFLKNDAWVLEDAGFKISIPAWWTPKGRQRARVRVKASGSAAPAQEKGTGTGYFSLPSLVQYDYQLSIGGQPVTEAEWRALVNAKTPLIHFRGEWMEVDQEQMESLLAFWKQQQDGEEAVALTELLRRSAEADEETMDFTFDENLSHMLSCLQDHQRLELMESPPGLHGELREYQKRGLSWLSYLESLALNPCLADDMGLGKTIQVIARLIQERGGPGAGRVPPTLLIAPTSVLGNWQKEIQRFATQLTVLLHHGSIREQNPKAFEQAAQTHDVVITSFSLARRDAKLLNPMSWHRIVIDEAQNIKNPKSAQTRAIFKLQARHRLAMTGTPIENRLMDLWSIFHFLNPGYLGTATQFKRAYETPIQKHSDTQRSAQLKKLITPFILRRLKTDKSIIRDLPDKIEQKVYCNLTQEQASLYQVVVDEVQQALEQAEGIQRKGLILSTLMRLKQICNHPAQFLHDGSEFSASRSHKLARVSEMVEEAIVEGDSLLLFTQFTEIGEALETHFRDNYHYPVYYLHGGTTRVRRERMMGEFQDADSAPAIFILSLKAGGVGITLTKANHVFHFDRWWNPAVEDQATDRAFRIGQEKTVFAHKLVALGTLEERIDQMLEEKQKLAERIVGSDESWLTELDNDAFRKLIRLNRNSILEA